MAVSLAAAVFGADQQGDVPEKDADSPVRQLLDRIFSERSELLAGQYTATGRTVRRFAPKFDETKGDITVYCAFDYVRGLLRWERREPRLLLDRDAPNRPGTVIQSGYRFIKTPDKCYAQDLIDAVDTRIIGIELADFVPKNLGVPYDVRTFGLDSWGPVSEHVVTLDSTKARFSKFADIEFKELGKGKVELHCAVAPDVEQTWRIDTAHGDTVTYSQLDVFERAKQVWHEAIDKAEVSWEERNGVWVPTALLLERRYNGVETYEIELNWESVNEELPDDEFEPEALHVPRGTRLADSRLGGKSIIVGEIHPRNEPAIAPQAVPLGGTGWGYWTLAIAVAAVFVLLGAWFWRARMNGPI